MARRSRKTLSDLLGDPLTRAVMEADGVDAEKLETALADIARMLATTRRSRPRPTGLSAGL